MLSAALAAAAYPSSARTTLSVVCGRWHQLCRSGLYRVFGRSGYRLREESVSFAVESWS